MYGRDWEQLGEEIRRTIQDAIEYGNYDRLNQTISQTINQTVDWVSKGVQGVKNSTMDVTEQRERKRVKTELYKTGGKTVAEGVLCAVFGYGIMVPMLVASIAVGMSATMLEAKGIYASAVLAILAPFILIGGILAIRGTKSLKALQRFKTYVKEIGNAEFTNVRDLAEKIRKSPKYVVKDLERMIRKGWFVQGHLDKQKTCLIVTEEMYREYQRLELSREQYLQEEAKKQQRLQGRPEVQKIILQGEEYLAKIRQCNDAISGAEISRKISRIENVVDRIFERVEKNPQEVGDVRKFMDYYLPTTIKLLEAYAEMDAQPVSGENIQMAKKEIEDTLDTLNQAFEKLLDGMFQRTAWDVSSDISVLNTMLAQEGLKEDGLRK